MIENPRQSLDYVPYLRKNKWGFASVKTREVIIECNYEEVSLFYEGLAAIKLNNRWGYIDKNGKNIIPCMFDSATYFNNGLALVTLNDKYGYINQLGHIVIPLQYDYADHFKYGVASVVVGKKYGFIDKTGEVIIPIDFEYGYIDRNGLIHVQLDDKHHGLYNVKGEELLPCIYSEISSEFSDGLAPLYKNGYSGWINAKGQKVIPCKFDTAYNFSDGLALVYTELYYWAFIDTKGAIVFRGGGYNLHVLDFSEGLAQLNKVGWHDKPNNYGYIDKKGTEVIPCIYDSSKKFTEGLAAVSINERWGYVNTLGQIVIPLKFGSAEPFKWGFACVQRNNKWGVIDKQGDLQIPCIYDSILQWDSEYFRISQGAKYGLINAQGKVIIPVNYDSLSELQNFDNILRVRNSEQTFYINYNGYEYLE